MFRISSDSKLGQIGSLTGTAGSSGSPQAPISAFANSLILNGGALQATTTANFILDSKRGIGLGPTDGATGGTGTLTVDSGVTLTYGGIIASAGNTGTQTLGKNGHGTLVLNGANTFTGNTQVDAGTLSGTGSLVSSLAVGSSATVAPGLTGIGTFAVGAGSTLGGTLAVTVDPASAGASDLFSVGGLFDLTVGTSTVDFTTLGTLDDPAYVFASYGSLSGTFGTATNLPTGYTIDYGYLGNFIALVPVPEPMAISTVGSAVAMALLMRWRRRA